MTRNFPKSFILTQLILYLYRVPARVVLPYGLPHANPEADSVSANASPGVFATTHWSVVLAAGQGDSPHAAAALEKLCRAYWYPLYAYVRRRGSGPEDAQDGTQSFFARLLERDLLSRASPQRGRFRSFLLTALQNFLADEHDRAVAHKRGAGQPLIALDALDGEARYALEPSDDVSPDKLFERRWATTVLEQAWRSLEAEYAAEGKADLFRELRRFNSALESAPGYAEVAGSLGLPENTVKSLVLRMRRRYRVLLRAEIGQTVADPEEVDEEIRYLLRVLEA
jgi:DNA-directed RNA polymerase specialized sigma24 family protein